MSMKRVLNRSNYVCITSSLRSELMALLAAAEVDLLGGWGSAFAIDSNAEN